MIAALSRCTSASAYSRACWQGWTAVQSSPEGRAHGWYQLRMQQILLEQALQLGGWDQGQHLQGRTLYLQAPCTPQPRCSMTGLRPLHILDPTSLIPCYMELSECGSHVKQQLIKTRWTAVAEHALGSSMTTMDTSDKIALLDCMRVPGIPGTGGQPCLRRSGVAANIGQQAPGHIIPVRVCQASTAHDVICQAPVSMLSQAAVVGRTAEPVE